MATVTRRVLTSHLRPFRPKLVLTMVYRLRSLTLSRAKAEKFGLFPIETIKAAVLYEDDPASVTLPHIAGEWKGRGKNIGVHSGAASGI